MKVPIMLFALLAGVLTVQPRAQMSWSLLAPTAVPARSDHGMVYDSCRQRVVVHAGLLAGVQQANDTWEWDGQSWFQTIASSPAPRSQCAMAFDSLRCRTMLFGGWNKAASAGGTPTMHGDTWQWDGTIWTLAATSGPPARSGAAMAYDPLRDRTVLFGGIPTGGGAPHADVWEWDGTSWQQVPTSATVAGRIDATLTFVPLLGQLLLVGGDANPGHYSDMWSWNGSQWSYVGVSPAVSGHGAAWHADRQRLVASGGWLASGPSPNTYEWDGVSWLLTHTGAQSYDGMGLAFDGASGDVLQFGGLVLGSGQSDELRAYRATTPHDVQVVGAGCATGSAPTLTAPAPALVGATQFGLELLGGAALTPVVFALADASSGAQTFGACSVVPDLATSALVAGIVGFDGVARLPFPLPATAALSGFDLFAQALLLDGPGPMLGLGSLSDALRITVGD